MKIVICDDDVNFSSLIADDFKNYFYGKIDNLDITIINHNFTFYTDYQVDICFMDIDLINENGIEIIKKIKHKNKNLITIFISSREDLVFDTFSVEPFQFIRKNHYKSDLYDTFQQLEWKISNQYAKIMIRDNKRYIRLDVEEIISVISIMHDLIINTVNGTYYSTGTLKHFYEENKNTSLVQIKKNMIINIDRIYAITKNSILYEDGKEYEIGRVYRNDFKRKYEEYIYDN